MKSFLGYIKLKDIKVQNIHKFNKSIYLQIDIFAGDRRFSKWKGSVVDSVVGVFLTQNVSDHLSR